MKFDTHVKASITDTPLYFIPEPDPRDISANTFVFFLVERWAVFNPLQVRSAWSPTLSRYLMRPSE